MSFLQNSIEGKNKRCDEREHSMAINNWNTVWYGDGKIENTQDLLYKERKNYYAASSLTEITDALTSDI